MTDATSDRAGAALDVARLAAMNPVAYDRTREQATKDLSVCASTLDALVRAARRAADPNADETPLGLCNHAAALAFSALPAGQPLFVAEWGRCPHCGGARCARDATLAVFDLARATCREKAAVAAAGTRDDGGWITKTASGQKLAAVERLARSARRHARASDDIDAGPWALNTPGGVVDLRSERMRPHHRTDLFKKVMAAGLGDDFPLWRAFVGEIVQSDGEVLAYLQRWAGYMLTGEVRGHAFLFLLGPGDKGKSVLANTLAAALSAYAANIPVTTFMVSHGGRHPTESPFEKVGPPQPLGPTTACAALLLVSRDPFQTGSELARLRGVQRLLAQETEADRVLAESRLKSLTGGHRVPARFVHQNFFEYTPALKLVMVGNQRPAIRNPDDARRHRLHLLPLTFKPAKPGQELPTRLRGELPGILQWAIDGCVA